MAAGKYPWKICQGADEQLVFQWLDARGLGVDLSAYTLRMQIRAGPYGSDSCVVVDGDPQRERVGD